MITAPPTTPPATGPARDFLLELPEAVGLLGDALGNVEVACTVGKEVAVCGVELDCIGIPFVPVNRFVMTSARVVASERVEER
jgi:hypothetical protein